jgi:hypothetical protein
MNEPHNEPHPDPRVPLIGPLRVQPWVRAVVLTCYYTAIILGLILIYGRGNFTTPTFIYQGF